MMVCARDRIVPVKLAAELALVYVLQLLEGETILQVCQIRVTFKFMIILTILYIIAIFINS